MLKFCSAIFPLNSLKNQQQIDNAKILHFNFEKYKIWMLNFCRASFHHIHYKNNITKLVSKCAGGINEHLLLMFYRPGKNSKNLRGGQLAPTPLPPLLYARGLNLNSRCKLKPAKTAVSTECPRLRTYRQELATVNGKTPIAARSEKRRPF